MRKGGLVDAHIVMRMLREYLQTQPGMYTHAPSQCGPRPRTDLTLMYAHTYIPGVQASACLLTGSRGRLRTSLTLRPCAAALRCVCVCYGSSEAGDM
jgi:hypothetical protein